MSSGTVAVEGEVIALDRMYIVSEFDFKRRTVSSSLDALFFRNAETYMLDNRDRIQEINQYLQGKVKISDMPVVMEQVPVLDPGKLVFSRKSAQIANPIKSNQLVSRKTNHTQLP